MMSRMNAYARELPLDQLAYVIGGMMDSRVYENMRSKILASDLSDSDKRKALNLLKSMRDDVPDQKYSEEYVNKVFKLHFGI